METLTSKQIASRLAAQQVPTTVDEAESLAEFLNLLEHWNRVHNLTGIRDRGELIDRHLVESLSLKPFVLGPTAADVGSGGGLPGVPLAITLPELSFTLIESRRKRASFLRHAAATLGLKNIAVAHSRAENLSTGPFKTVLARAVAPPAELLAVCRPLLSPDGRLVLLTGDDKAREIIALADDFASVTAETGHAALKSRIVVLDRRPVS